MDMDVDTVSGDNKIKVFLTSDILDVNEAVKFVSTFQSGAISVFLGTTRETEPSSDETNSKISG